MKLLKLVLSFSFLLVVPLQVVESLSQNDTSVTNVTRGSSISPAPTPSSTFITNITRGSSLYVSSNDISSYWLSPSGNLAFGFYMLPCCSDEYVVGIWIVKSSQKTLVWTANRNDLPLHKPSSILFTSKGKLMRRIMPFNKEKPLIPDIQEPVSYAMMHDDGNFVLYGSSSQIVWESFDYPTDTILGGQKIRPGVDLNSRKHRLSVRQTDGFVGIYRKTNGDVRDHGAETVSVMSDPLKGSLSCPVILRLDITGRLYLASSDNEVVKVFYQDERKQQVKEEGEYIYRATLSSKGRLNLYKERIDGNASDPDQMLSSLILWTSYRKNRHVLENVLVGVGISFILLIVKAIPDPKPN